MRSSQSRTRSRIRFAIRSSIVLGLTIATSSSILAQDRNKSKPATGKVSAQPVTAVKSIKDADTTPTVVATVNGQSIMLTELAQQCVLRFGEDVLENIVNKQLILQACIEKKIEIESKDVNEEIGRIASKFGLTQTAYLKLLKDERNMSPEHYASDVVWPMLALRALARDKIQVTPQEIDRAFQSEFGPKVQVRMIACRDLEKVKTLRKQALANPDSFKALARDNSEDQASASVEGLLPPIRRYTGDDELENIAFKLRPGEISEIFPAGEVHVTLQCVRHYPAANPPAPQQAEIQARIKSELEEQKLRDHAESVYTDLRSRSQVVIVLKQPELQKQYAGVAAIINGQSVPMEMLERECVKRFGPQTLKGEINRKVVEDAVNRAKIQITQGDLDTEIRNTAEYFGYLNADGTPDIKRWMDEVLAEDGKSIELYMRDAVWPSVALKKLVAARVQVTEDDLRKGFESSYGPRAEILAIVLSNQRSAQEVWELARNNPTEQFFGELANQYSVEPSSRSNYGKVPPLRRFGGQPNLEKAAFDLKPGDLSGIVEVGGQYVILRCQGFTKPVVQDFNAVKNELGKDIYEKKLRLEMDTAMTQLTNDAQIVNLLSPKESGLGNSRIQEAVQQSGLDRTGAQERPTARK